MNFLQNLNAIATFKKYSSHILKASEIVLDGLEPCKVHMSSRYATYLNLVFIFNQFSQLQKLIDFLKQLKEAKVYKDSYSNNQNPLQALCIMIQAIIEISDYLADDKSVLSLTNENIQKVEDKYQKASYISALYSVLKL